MGWLTKIRKEPVMTTMVVRMVMIFAASYGLTLSEEQVTPLIVGGWTIIEVITSVIARQNVVPTVKLEGKDKIPAKLKEKIND